MNSAELSSEVPRRGEKKLFVLGDGRNPIEATEADLKELGFAKVQAVIDWLDFRVGDFSIGEFKKKFESSFGDENG